MRLGGPLFQPYDDPDGFVRAARAAGYTACFCPTPPDADEATERAYAEAAAGAGLVIAEVGAWSNNPLSPDADERKLSIERTQAKLALADRVGARCCVNIAGSRNPEKWDGPHPDNISDTTFDMIVESVRAIIDGVKPKRAAYALEMMPWVPPYDLASMQRLLDAVDRDAFAVHFDPVNLINSPIVHYRNGAMIRELVRTLGPRIRCVHLKDTALSVKLTTQLTECRPGTGGLDYRTLLRELDRLDPDLPAMLEHLPNEAEYQAAAAFVRQTASEEGVTLR